MPRLPLVSTTPIIIYDYKLTSDLLQDLCGSKPLRYRLQFQAFRVQQRFPPSAGRLAPAQTPSTLCFLYCQSEQPMWLPLKTVFSWSMLHKLGSLRIQH